MLGLWKVIKLSKIGRDMLIYLVLFILFFVLLPLLIIDQYPINRQDVTKPIILPLTNAQISNR